MAEVAAKKSINVVSSKKNSEACSVQSNNGLIDLGNITSCSNNQLITLSDDDLLLTNNTKNDLNVDDKSLQELIESELALRISSTNDMDNGDEAEYDVIGYIEGTEVTRSQPEITKIVLEPRQNPQDVNSEFIIAEMNHYNIIEDRHVNQNGHFPPDIKPKLFNADTNVSEKVNDRNGSAETEIDQSENTEAKATIEQTIITENSAQTNTATIRDICGKEIPVSAAIGDVEEGLTRVVPDDKFHLDNVDGDSSRLIFTMDNVVRDKIKEKVHSPSLTPQSAERIYQEAEDSDSRIAAEDYDYSNLGLTEQQSESKDSFDQMLDTSSKTTELADTWSNTESSGDTLQIGQFSDNFDESLQQIDNPVQLGSDAEVPVSQEQKLDLGILQNQVTDNSAKEVTNLDLKVEDSGKIIETYTERASVATEDSNVLDVQTEPTDEISYEPKTQQVNNTVVSGEKIVGDAEVIREVESPAQNRKSEGFENSDQLLSIGISSTRDFINSERGDVRESMQQVLKENVEAIEENVSQDPSLSDAEVNDVLTTQTTIIEDSREVRKSTKTTSVVEIIQTTEKTSSNETPRVFSDSKYADHCFVETPSQGQDFESWTTVEQAISVPYIKETTEAEGVPVISNESNSAITNPSDDWTAVDLQQLAPLATPDDEISDVSNKCDLHIENREEVITTTSVVTSSTTSAKSAKTTKTKKKKIEGVANSDASPGLTPRTKKTKKSKKSDPEKENISVNGNIDESNMRTKIGPTHPEKVEPADDDELSNVNVKTLTQSYVSETNRGEQEKSSKEIIATGVSIKQLCRSFGDLSNMSDTEVDAFGQEDHDMPDSEEKSSFNKFDALSKKSVLHVRSVDAGKVQQQFNSVAQNGEPNPNCRSCGKVVFQMEQTKAEGLIWHKNCFRCNQCSKQLSVDNYQSHEATLYCKAHFKELFQPKPVEESDQPTSDKPDLGLEELSALNVKSRFQVFEKTCTEATDIERSPSQVAVKRSPSILSKLAKFQAKGMDIGVADESLNGIPYEESSESEEEEEDNDEVDTEIIKAKRSTRERPMSFSKMDDMKNRWESTSQQGRRESQREARKEEIAGIRSRLFMGKQGKMKEMYQQAVAESERVTKINASEEIQEIQQTAHARSIKERFERGEPIAANEDENPEDKFKHQDRADEEVIAAGISKKSRSLFLELDATAAKTARPVTPVTPKTPAESSRRARDMESPEREIYRDPEVVRADDRVDEVVHTDTARKMLSIFRQMEEKASKEDLPDGPKPLKRFTPPPEDKFAKPTASESEEEDDDEGEESEAGESSEERDPNYVRASDKVEDEFLKQAQTAARAKTLRAKFEHWETTDDKVTNHNVAEMEIAQGAGDQSSIESASSLRARFESLGSQPSEAPRTAKVKVNRFVEIQTTCTEVCESCEKKVYPLEKVETNNKIFHKQCFRCLQCNCILRMDTFTLNNGKLYCIPHFKQLFITRGNYDEGFGINPHKNKWASSNAASPAIAITSNAPTPIAVSNGDL